MIVLDHIVGFMFSLDMSGRREILGYENVSRRQIERRSSDYKCSM